MRKGFRLMVIVAAATSATFDVSALGLGPITTSTTLGQPLDISVPVRLDDDERIDAECVSADVIFGETRVDPALVHTAVEGVGGDRQRAIRVRTSVAVVEPILSLTVRVVCGQTTSRSVNLFADPPPRSVNESGADDELGSARSTQAVAVQQAAPVDAQATAANDVSSVVAPSDPVARVSRTSERPRRTQVRRPTLKGSKSVAPSAVARPRLRLDVSAQRVAAPSPQAPVMTPVSAESVASGAEQEAAAAAAAAAEKRLGAIESEMLKLRVDALRHRENLRLVQSRMHDAETRARAVPVLVIATVLLAALAAWLAWRLRKTGTKRRTPWWSATAVPRDSTLRPAAATPSLQSELSAPTTSAHAAEVTLSPAAHASSDRQVAAKNEWTAAPAEQAKPTVKVAGAQLAGDVWMDDHFDIEQQADFFLVLGQDDEAIELLKNHLRGAGASNPMPYLKLLEIYRRRDDGVPFESTRARFNERFNALVPGREVDPTLGKALESYPEVVSVLQSVWWSPLDAMAELEALLFRKSEDAVLFDLPAFHDLLFLYHLARWLHQQPDQASGSNVDLLLPIGDDTQATSA